MASCGYLWICGCIDWRCGCGYVSVSVSIRGSAIVLYPGIFSNIGPTSPWHRPPTANLERARQSVVRTVHLDGAGCGVQGQIQARREINGWYKIGYRSAYCALNIHVARVSVFVCAMGFIGAAYVRIQSNSASTYLHTYQLLAEATILSGGVLPCHIPLGVRTQLRGHHIRNLDRLVVPGGSSFGRISSVGDVRHW